ncbi:MAG: HD domain-containing protein [Candidatus Micrarchaeaceae archaeon]
MRDRYIRDPIFGNIKLSDTEQRILDTRAMQRLRRIKQLGNAYLVYPGSTHTRFAHSLGTMEIAKRMSNQLLDEEREDLALVGLLHDVGHAPLSHTLDNIYAEYLHKSHEQIGLEIISNSEIGDEISAAGLTKAKFSSLFNGKGEGKVITGALGADRIDYLSRDAYYTGVALGIIDFNRIIGKMVMHGNTPAMEEGGIVGAESLLIARYFMFSSVYAHHAVAIANLMASKAANIAISEGYIDPKELIVLDDNRLEARLIESPAKAMQQRITDRRLYKKAVFTELGENERIKISEIDMHLSKAGLDYEDYVVDIITFKPGGDIEIVKKSGNSAGMLGELSALVKTLNELMGKKRMLIIACDRKNESKVKRVIGKIL